jgi:hypothetical protein
MVNADFAGKQGKLALCFLPQADSSHTCGHVQGGLQHGFLDVQCCVSIIVLRQSAVVCTVSVLLDQVQSLDRMGVS